MQYMDLSATVGRLKTTFGFLKTGNSANERHLTSNATLMVVRRDVRSKSLQNGDKQRPTTAYAQTGSRNMAETT